MKEISDEIRKEIKDADTSRLCFPTQTFHTFATNLIINNITSYENCALYDNSDVIVEIRKQSP